MTDETKPQRFQPRSRSPLADPAPSPAAPKRAGRPPRKASATTKREPVSAPTEDQLEAMRPPEERAPAEAGGAPRRKKGNRVPFGTREAKLAVPEREGFTRRWFNDEPGRIARARKAGYENVIDEETGKPLEMLVTVSANKSGGTVAFCMEIPNEFYDEDFAAKQEALDIIDMQIQKGTHKQEPGDARYVPTDAIKFGTTRR